MSGFDIEFECDKIEAVMFTTWAYLKLFVRNTSTNQIGIHCIRNKKTIANTVFIAFFCTLFSFEFFLAVSRVTDSSTLARSLSGREMAFEYLIKIPYEANFFFDFLKNSKINVELIKIIENGIKKTKKNFKT